MRIDSLFMNLWIDCWWLGEIIWFQKPYHTLIVIYGSWGQSLLYNDPNVFILQQYIFQNIAKGLLFVNNFWSILSLIFLKNIMTNECISALLKCKLLFTCDETLLYELQYIINFTKMAFHYYFSIIFYISTWIIH